MPPWCNIKSRKYSRFIVCFLVLVGTYFVWMIFGKLNMCFIEVALVIWPPRLESISNSKNKMNSLYKEYPGNVYCHPSKKIACNNDLWIGRKYDLKLSKMTLHRPICVAPSCIIEMSLEVWLLIPSMPASKLRVWCPKAFFCCPIKPFI